MSLRDFFKFIQVVDRGGRPLGDQIDLDALYDPDQPRDDDGKWGGGGGDGSDGGDGSVEVTETQLNQRFPKVKAGSQVDGREVLSDIPNEDSIGASLDDYEVLPGVREVNMSNFEDTEFEPKFINKARETRVRDLASQIQSSKQLKPLIVVMDKQKSMYILEGSHRYDALRLIKAKSFPAKVVIDTGKGEVKIKSASEIDTLHGDHDQSSHGDRDGGGEGGGKKWSGGSAETNGIAAQSFRSKDEAKQAAKEAHQDLKKAGFVKQTREKKVTPSEKMGRSEAYSGGSVKYETIYKHADGRVARLVERYPKYGDKKVSITHDSRFAVSDLDALYDPDQPRDDDGKWGPGGGDDADDAGGSEEEELDFDSLKPSDDEIDAMSDVKERHDDYIEQLSGDDARRTGDTKMADALEDYSGDGYLKMNARLRDNPDAINDFEEDDDDEHDDAFGRSRARAVDASATHMSDAINNAPKLKKPVTVYRGIGGRLNVKAGDQIKLNGFQSSTFEAKVAASFMKGDTGTLMKIRAKRGLSLGDHSRGGEAEFIMDHGEKYRVVSTRSVRQKNAPRGPNRIRVIELEQL